MSGISSAIASGGNQSGTTGVNQNAVGQQAINYETNTGGTNLASATPGLNTFYQGEMKNGLNQQTQLNAQNQLQQQFGQSEAAIKNSAAPGTNTANQQQQAQNQLISGSTNLAGNLAGQNQSTMAQGAAGVASTAGGLDTQTMNMLTSALSGSQGLNTTSLANLMSVLGLGTGAAASGAADIGAANTSQGGLFTGYGTQAGTFGQQAASNSQSSGLGGILGDVSGLVSPIKL
jgi:hypothetical protein